MEFKRFIASLLCVLLVITSLPVDSFASNLGPKEKTETNFVERGGKEKVTLAAAKPASGKPGKASSFRSVSRYSWGDSDDDRKCMFSSLDPSSLDGGTYSVYKQDFKVEHVHNGTVVSTTIGEVRCKSPSSDGSNRVYRTTVYYDHCLPDGYKLAPGQITSEDFLCDSLSSSETHTVRVVPDGSIPVYTVRVTYVGVSRSADTYQVLRGKDITITAPNIAGYSVNNKTVTLRSVYENKEVTFTYTPNSHTITIARIGAAGSDAPRTVARGGSITIYPTQLEGYNVTPNQHVLTNVTSDRTVIFNYIKKTYTIRVEAYIDGVYETDSHVGGFSFTQTVRHGESVTITPRVITPIASSVTPERHVLNNVTRNQSVRFDYTLNSYPVTVNVTKKGRSSNIVSYPVEQVKHGKDIVIRAKQVAGHTVSPEQHSIRGIQSPKTVTFDYTPVNHTVTVKYSGISKSPDTYQVEHGEDKVVYPYNLSGYRPNLPMYTFRNVTGDDEYTFTYRPITYTITYVMNGVSETRPPETVAHGVSKRVNAPRVTGYDVTPAYIDFNDITENKTATFNYTKKRHTVTVNYSGITRPAATYQVEHGGSFVAQAPTVEGYTPDTSSYTFSNVTSPRSHTFVYSKKRIRLTIKYSGIARDNDVHYVDYGEQKTVTPPDVEGYDVTPASHTFRNPTSDRNFTFNYRKKTYPVTVTYEGVTRDADTYNVEHGADKEVTAPSIEGYTCAEQSYTFRNVTAPASHVFRYTKNQFTVTYNANGGTPNPSAATVQAGEAIQSLPVVTRDGHKFLGWSEFLSGGSYAAAPYTPRRNVTLYAIWEEKLALEIIKEDTQIDRHLYDRGTSLDKAAVGQLLASISKPNYRISHLSESANGTEVVYPIVMTSNKKLYVVWEKDPSKWSKAIILSDGEREEKIGLTGTSIEGVNLSPEKPGKLFVRWDPKEPRVYEGELTSPVTYNAIWAEDANNNKIADNVEANAIFISEGSLEVRIVGQDGDALRSKVQNPRARPGYVFSGWDKEIPENFNWGRGDNTFTAVWEVDANNDGVADKNQAKAIYMVENSQIGVTIGNVGSPITGIPKAADTDSDFKVFIGWYDQQDGQGNPIGSTYDWGVAEKRFYAFYKTDANNDGKDDDAQATAIFNVDSAVVSTLIGDVNAVITGIPKADDTDSDNKVFAGWFTLRGGSGDPLPRTFNWGSTVKNFYAHYKEDLNNDGKADDGQAKISYYTDINTLLKSVEGDVGSAINDIPTPEDTSADNRVFLGWYTQTGGAGNEAPTTYNWGKGELKVYAHWGDDRNNDGIDDARQVIAEFNTESGTVVKIGNKGTAIEGAPTAPAKPGQVFVGWYTDAEETFSDPKVPDTFSWDIGVARRFSMRYKADSNGDGIPDENQATAKFVDGASTVGNVIGKLGDNLTAPDAGDTSSDGKKFIGWFDRENGQGSQVPSTFNWGASEKTFYAFWKTDANNDGKADDGQVVVVFKVDGRNEKTETVDIGSALVAPDVADTDLDNRIFIGWSVDNSIKKSNELGTANWAAGTTKEFIATFKADIDNDGKTDDQQATASFYNEDLLVEKKRGMLNEALTPPDVTDTGTGGKVFVGWFEQKGARNNPVPSTYNWGASEKNFYAVFDIDANNDGIADNTQVTAVFISGSSREVRIGNAGAPINPVVNDPDVEANKVFVGWYTSNDETFTNPKIADVFIGNAGTIKEYTARIADDLNGDGIPDYRQVTVIFKVDSNIVKTETVDIGTLLVAPDVADIADDNRVFIGWQVDGSTKKSNELGTANWTAGTSKEFVAKFATDTNNDGVADNSQVTAIFKVDGVAIKTELINVGTNLVAPVVDDTDSDNRIFTGWTVDGVVKTSDSLGVANWSPGTSKEFVATFATDANNDGVIDSTQATAIFNYEEGAERVIGLIGSSLTAPRVPAKAGYVFNGWSTEASGNGEAAPQTFNWGSAEKAFYPVFSEDPTMWSTVRFTTDNNLDIGQAQRGIKGVTNIAVPQPVEKRGYTFSGWTYGGRLYGAQEITKFTEGNNALVVYVAAYTKNDSQWRTAIFYNEDGTEFKRVEGIFGEAFVFNEAPKKEGYTFVKWSPEKPDTFNFDEKEKSFTPEFKNSSGHNLFEDHSVEQGAERIDHDLAGDTLEDDFFLLYNPTTGRRESGVTLEPGQVINYNPLTGEKVSPIIFQSFPIVLIKQSKSVESSRMYDNYKPFDNSVTITFNPITGSARTPGDKSEKAAHIGYNPTNGDIVSKEDYLAGKLYSPITGKKIDGSMVDAPTALLGFDAYTGAPIYKQEDRPIIGYDPITGRRIFFEGKQVFNPTTGKASINFDSNGKPNYGISNLAPNGELLTGDNASVYNPYGPNKNAPYVNNPFYRPGVDGFVYPDFYIRGSGTPVKFGDPRYPMPKETPNGTVYWWMPNYLTANGESLVVGNEVVTGSKAVYSENKEGTAVVVIRIEGVMNNVIYRKVRNIGYKEKVELPLDKFVVEGIYLNGVKLPAGSVLDINFNVSKTYVIKVTGRKAN